MSDYDCYGLVGLSYRQDAEGQRWLTFRTIKGRSASINLNVLADRQGGLIGSAINEWGNEREAERRRQDD